MSCSCIKLIYSVSKKPAVWMQVQVVVFFLTEAIPLCSNKIIQCNIFRLYTTIYQYSDIYLYIYSDHIMATCFDRKTVIMRPIKSIFKVQKSEHSMGSYFFYSKS